MCFVGFGGAIIEKVESPIGCEQVSYLFRSSIFQFLVFHEVLNGAGVILIIIIIRNVGISFDFFCGMCM